LGAPALGAFYRRLSARVSKAKAITATVRKIAVLFYNALRHGMDYVDWAPHTKRLAIESGFSRIFVAAPRPSASLCKQPTR
jgi:hypothetical protein